MNGDILLLPVEKQVPQLHYWMYSYESGVILLLLVEKRISYNIVWTHMRLVHVSLTGKEAGASLTLLDVLM